MAKRKGEPCDGMDGEGPGGVPGIEAAAEWMVDASVRPEVDRAEADDAGEAGAKCASGDRGEQRPRYEERRATSGDEP